MLSALSNSELPFSQVFSALSEDQEGLEESSVFQTAFNVELGESAATGPVQRIAVTLCLSHCIINQCGLLHGIFPGRLALRTQGCMWGMFTPGSSHK